MIQIEGNNNHQCQEKLRQDQSHIKLTQAKQNACIFCLFLNFYPFHFYQSAIIILVQTKTYMNSLSNYCSCPIQCCHHHHITVCHEQPPLSRNQQMNQKFSVCLETEFQHYDCQKQRNGKDHQISQQQVLDGLLKHNSSLTKYLSKYYKEKEDQRIKREESNLYEETGSNIKKGQRIEKYKSIVEQKNLNFGIPDQMKQMNRQEPAQEKPAVQLAEFAQQTSPKQQKKKEKEPPKKLSQDEQKINQYFTNLRKSSRYLSDTGFRKYFNRQCFENYGRQNTNGVADGIVYGSYLKTFNINPHSGSNLPQKAETYEHSLIAASPNKYKEYKNIKEDKKDNIDENQRKCKQKTLNKQKQQCEQITHQNLEKREYNLSKTLEDNEKYNLEKKKYENIKLRKKIKEEKWEEQQGENHLMPFKAQGKEDPQNYLNKNKQVQKRQNSLAVRNQLSQYNNDKIEKIETKKAKRQQIFPQEYTRANQDKRIYEGRQEINQHQQEKQKFYPLIYNPPRIEIISQKNMSHFYNNSCCGLPQIQQFKQEVMEQSFKNSALASYIYQFANRKQCQSCKERRYTKCCCINI